MSLKPFVKRAIVTILFLEVAFSFAGCTNANSVLNSSNPLGSSDSSTSTSVSTSVYTSTSTNTYIGSSTYQINTATGTGGSSLPGNTVPVLNLKTSADVVGYSGAVTLTAEAVDPNGYTLTYSWTASDGVFINQTVNSATWKAPDHMADVGITCTVRNTKGAQTSKNYVISVVGGRKYQIELDVSRTSIYANNSGENLSGSWLPLAQAKISMPALNQTLVTDQTGKVLIDIDGGAKTASSTDVIITYLDWEVRFNTVFTNGTILRSDVIQFYPGYDGVTVAMGRGDSFQSKRGGIEVSAVEAKNGFTSPVSDFAVEVGNSLGNGASGVAFLSSNTVGGDVGFKVSKTGYADLSGLTIPTALDAVTLVQAKMLPAGKTSITDAFVSWSSPFSGQSAVPVIGPFTIGFGQPMEQSTIFQDLEMTIQDGAGTTIVVTGADIDRRFLLQWDGPTLLHMAPKFPLQPLKRYSMLVSRWNARAADGRLLKNYSGMFGVFTTDVDSAPVISATQPRNGDTGIGRSGPFVVKFDRPMDTTTLATNLLIEISDMVTGSKLSVDGSSLATEFSVLWTEDDTLLSLVPRRTLKSSHSYLVRLTRSGLKSRTGKAANGLNNLWGQFTTGEL
ncbi:MAG: Ig-like domain-containing protein [Candidatus Riflebacteria bacterium]|nr:Ig-like domain-containing protein [Candidatus Riflebacteria bacterium]